MATMTVWMKMTLKLDPDRKKGRTSGLAEKIPMTEKRPQRVPDGAGLE
jgi:hypothetical protein